MVDDHSQTAPPLLRQELGILQRQYSAVHYDADERAVSLDVTLGEGWTPRRITLSIRIPRGYPATAPQAVLPWELRCDGVVPRQMLSSGHWLIRGQLGDTIRYYPDWQATRTLPALVNTVVTELNALCPDETADVSRREPHA